ncbi:MAG TPA: hypothetical protein PLV92_30060, partial [Pirellulaceae bacterium]|nr:hypothetical protein [Pirellulaceae bacterium]
MTWTGAIVWPDGSRSTLHGVRESTTPMRASEAVETTARTTADATAGDNPRQTRREAFETFDVNYPLGAFGRAEPSPPRGPAAVLFRRGTIWTCGPAGVLSDADVLIVDGKVAAVGARITPPAGAEIVDLAGRHMTPGLIDPHSHIATDGGVNETGRAITCQVRIADFIDANDVNIYRQLAGGTTAALILHGSACPIGGQGEVIKFRWGLSARELRFAEAPPTVKFALGENVTKGPDILAGRYPHSRMGVEQLHRDAFVAAREYQRRWDEWQATRKGSVPRRDLELE